MDRKATFLAPALLPLLAAGGAGGCGEDPRPPATPAATASAPPAAVASASASAPAPRAARPAYPAAPKKPTAGELWGTKIDDAYQWLEDAKDPEVDRYVKEQNAFSRAFFDARPDRPKIRSRVAELLGGSSANTFDLRRAGGTWFALKHQPPKQQVFIVARSGLDDKATERVVVDPNVLDPSGKTTIDFYVPSKDGKLLAVSLSKGGSESGDVHVFDVATGKEKGDVVERVNGGTAGGSLAWTSDASGFYYTRYPKKGERPAEDLDFYQQVHFHKLGAKSEQDKYAIGKDFPRIAEVELFTSPSGRYVLAEVANGDGGEYEHHVLGPKGWVRLSRFEDKWTRAAFAKDDSLYVLSLKDAPRGKVLKLRSPVDPKDPELVVPQGDTVIQSVVPTATILYTVELAGGPSRLRATPLDKKSPPFDVPILPVSAVNGIAKDDGDDVVFRNESYLDPPAWYRFSAKEKKAQRTALFQTTKADMSDAEVVRETCTSKDGTKVPVNVIRKKGGPLDGARPTLLTGYGGYNLSRSPRLRPMMRLWLDQGGVFAEANLRGGGEFGEAWHTAGNLTKKQNVFDDFHACASTLVSLGYTSPAKLAIMGGSNGGLLMGASLVQHPEAFRAVVARVGIYDMLRVELTPNGAFNVTEYGTVKKEDQFRALHAYSPFHNVKDGVAYPAVLFTTGANDPRVDPFHSRKMTARLQAATASDRPILLRASFDTGHGMGTPLQAEIEEESDVYAFLLSELGVTFR